MMGGDCINHLDDVDMPTANLLLIKIFFNCIISTPEAKFANTDMSNFYLMTPLKRSEHAKIKIPDITYEIINEYKLQQKATSNGWIYICVVHGMYRLPGS